MTTDPAATSAHRPIVTGATQTARAPMDAPVRHRHPDGLPVVAPLERAVGVDRARVVVVGEDGGRADEDAVLEDGGLVHERVVLQLAVVTHPHPRADVGPASRRCSSPPARRPRAPGPGARRRSPPPGWRRRRRLHWARSSWARVSSPTGAPLPSGRGHSTGHCVRVLTASRSRGRIRPGRRPPTRSPWMSPANDRTSPRSRPLVVLVRPTDVETDSRAKKLGISLARIGYDVVVLGRSGTRTRREGRIGSARVTLLAPTSPLRGTPRRLVRIPVGRLRRFEKPLNVRLQRAEKWADARLRAWDREGAYLWSAAQRDFRATYGTRARPAAARCRPLPRPPHAAARLCRRRAGP